MAEKPAKNLALQAFREQFSTLYPALKSQPELVLRLASKFYKRTLISKEIKDAIQQMSSGTTELQAAWLLSEIQLAIAVNPRFLRQFLRVLRKESTLKSVAEAVQKHYRALISEAGQAETSSSDSDTDTEYEREGTDQAHHDQAKSEHSDSEHSELPRQEDVVKPGRSKTTAPIEKNVAIGFTGTRVKKETLPRFLNLLSPVLHSWDLFVQQIGVPADIVAQIHAANANRGQNWLYTCFMRAMDWWVANHSNPTYEVIIAVLDPESGQTTPVMNRTLSSQVKEFMVKEWETLMSEASQAEISSSNSETEQGEGPGPEGSVSGVSARIKDLEEKYSSLVKMTRRDVELKSPDIDDFRHEITLLPPAIKLELRQSLKENLSDIYSAKTVEEIFGLFNLQVWSFLNYGLLQHLVNIYGLDETKKMMKEYASSVESFRKETSLKVFWEAYPLCPTLPPDLKQKLRKVIFKHGNLSDATSLAVIENFRQDFCREFSLPDLIVILADIEKGSVTTVWFVPPAVETILSNELLRGNFQFLQQHCILEVKIEKTIYNAESPPPLASVVTTSDSQAEETPTEFPSPLASVVTSGDSQAEEILTEPPPPLASTVTSGDSQAEETSTESPPPTKRVLTSGDHESQEENKIPEINYSDLEFGAELGEGGFSTVYKGHWLSRDMDVAIKRLPGKLHEGEVKILNQLNHPSVVHFHGVVVDNPGREHYIVTELAEGGSLYDLLHKKHHKPSPEQTQQWATEIAEGMNYLHQKKMMHRDLKSSNVLLTDEGNIKICDFGGAKFCDHTTKQTYTGTYRWMAPEVMKEEPVSLSSDVFSYGMLLYEIFTGKLPFADDKADAAVISNIMKGKMPLIPDSIESYQATLMRLCWATDPKVRPSFQNILEILKTITLISFSDLEFEDELGKGKFGAVYKGYYKSRNMKVAIKRVPSKIHKGETEILRHLKHPNIIQFHGVVIDSPKSEHYIVTAIELAEGTSLYDLLHKKHHQPSPEQTQQWATEIAEGMNYLHQRNLLHKDLKSSNVLLTSEGNIKINDFGGAKFADHTTSSWMAPEVISGEPVSFSSDVFSYGMLLYEIFTSKRPFANVETDAEVISKIESKEMPPIPASTEPYIAALIRLCWATDPKVRPSFEDILEILKTRGDLSGLSSRLAQLMRITIKESQLLDPQSKLKWRRGADLPVAMVRPYLVRIGHYIYCGGGITAKADTAYLVFKYDTTTDIWSPLPRCPTCYHGLSQHNAKLVSTGGVKRGDPLTAPTKSIHVFQDSNWVAALPPMHTARFRPSTFTYNTHLIVCGGVTSYTSLKQYTCTSTVEMLNSETGQWSTLAPLPFALRLMSVAVCDDKCYLIRGADQGGIDHTACSAPLPLLMEGASQPSPWEVLPDCPLLGSTAAVLGGCVLALGGMKPGDSIDVSTDIHLYSRNSKSWRRTTAVNLPIASFNATSTTLAEDSIIVVGGSENPQNMLNTVFILKFEN